MASSYEKSNVSLGPGDDLLKDVDGLDLVDMEIDFDPGTSRQIVFDLGRAVLRYDCESKELKVAGVDDQAKVVEETALTGLAPRDRSVKLRFLVDRLSVETYAFGGEQFHANYVSPLEGDDKASITAEGGEAKVNSFVLRKLRSAWQ